jgi:hypothetical protein
MKRIRIQEAVGKVLGHDVTQIIPGVYKGPRFKRGHLITKEDIPEFLKMGKEHLFVMEPRSGILHEDEAALRLSKAFAGPHIECQGPSEGKVTFFSKIHGLLKIHLPLLNRINQTRNIILSTLHRYTPCHPGMAIGATRIISLTAPDKQIQRVENWCDREGPVLEILPYRKREVGVIVTGTEIYGGMIKDQFDDTVGKKISNFGARIAIKLVLPDKASEIAQALRGFMDKPLDLILVTGGLSVDPDDVTRAGIRRAGTKIIFYGTPVLPGAMFLCGMLGEKPVLGLPACVFYHSATLFDILFPRILAEVPPTRKEIHLLGHGGYCQNCNPCHFPVCPFGKG